MSQCEYDNLALPVSALINQMSETPEHKYIFRGIIQPSVGAIFGPAKSAKTITGETLLMSLAAGLPTFLDGPLQSYNSRVLIVGMEEYYRSRTMRNLLQLRYITETNGLSPVWQENVFVVGENFPRYMLSGKDWDKLESEIIRIKPGIVMLDSLTRLTADPLEDSVVASNLLRKLRELSHKHEIVVLLIHHTQKVEDRPITLATLAGSRVVGQELDFMIGLNRTNDNQRYLKDVAYRYAPDDSEQVQLLRINPTGLIVEPAGLAYESQMFGSVSKKGAINDELVYNALVTHMHNNQEDGVRVQDLINELVSPGQMSKPTLYKSLYRLQSDRRIAKISEGVYMLRTEGLEDNSDS